MSNYSHHEAYTRLMSAKPGVLASGGIAWRNISAIAAGLAQQFRSHGASAAAGGGSSGAAVKAQAEAHAAWFDQVATDATWTWNKLAALADGGHAHQAVGETAEVTYAITVTGAVATHPLTSVVDMVQADGTAAQKMNAELDKWTASYKAYNPPTAPPTLTGSGGGSGGSGGPGAGGTGPAGGAGAGGAGAGAGAGPGAGAGAGAGGAGAGSDDGYVAPFFPDPGQPGSVVAGQDAGQFAGWFKDPTTGFLVDPATGREYDPGSGQWVDPVTGQPFGATTPYSSRLEGVGGAGGPLTAPDGTLSFPGGGPLGSFGPLSGLVAAGTGRDTISGLYNNMLPPSLARDVPGGSWWQQAANSLAVKQQVAQNLIAREQAARTGRAYLPPTQAGAGGGDQRRKDRPKYVTATRQEWAMFCSPGALDDVPEGGFATDNPPAANPLDPGWDDLPSGTIGRPRPGGQP